MRRLILAAVFSLFSTLAAHAGSGCSSIVTGAVLTAAQWNACFSTKQNELGYTPVNKAGDSMTGLLTTVAPTTTTAGFRLNPGTAPTSPTNGDIWTTSAGLYVQVNGSTIGPLSGPTAGSFAGTSPITVSFPAGVVTYAFNFAIANVFTAQQTINLNGTAAPTAITGAGFVVNPANSTVGRVQINSYGAISAFTGVVYAGTAAAPTQVLSGTQLTGINAYAYTGSAVVGPIASFRTYAAENISSTAWGTKACIGTTPSTTAVLTDSLCQQNSGGVTIGSPTGGDKGAGTLNAAGTIYINGTAVTAAGITALTGDVTATGPGSVAATLATTQPNAHTWQATQTITPAANSAALTVTAPQNSSGTYDLISGNIATSAQSGTNLLSLSVNSVVLAKIDRNGQLFSSIINGFIGGSAKTSMDLTSDGAVTISNSGGTAAIIFSAKANASFQYGAADAATAVAQTVRVQSVVAGTAAANGANWTFIGSLPTGTGTSGDIIFQTGVKTGSGTTQGTATTALTIKGESQALQIAAGTLGVPALSFGTDTAGWYRNASNIWTFTTAGTTHQFSLGAHIFRLASQNVFCFAQTDNSTDSCDVSFVRAAAGSFQHGGVDVDLNSAIVAQTVRTQGALTGGTTNQAGKDFTVIVSPGKGTGAGGSFIVQTAPAGSTGSTTNTPVTALTINSAGQSTFVGKILATPAAGGASTIGFAGGGTAGFDYSTGTSNLYVVSDGAGNNFGFGGTTLTLRALGTLAFSVNTTVNNGSGDTGVSRVSAGVIGIGTGITGSVAGTISVATIINGGITTDAAHTDSTVCQDTTTHQYYFGSGTLGICLGTSGRQFKTEITPMVAGLDDLMKVDFINYRYRAGYGDGGARKQYGTTAQNVEAAIPDLARQNANGETINFDSGALLFVGLRAIQQLKADNDNLRAEIETLKRASR